ncbi:MAG: phospho-N-acetylmuramoyl-pentapeptide-transferase [Verrucomicrobia bacterium]|nr:phospho-N-acetylmuramoyl-pentapeptide-transferase [Verrucomicrobiota bacterium]
MLSFLADYENIWGPLRLLRFLTFRALLAALTATVIGFVIGPWLITHLRRLKFGQHYDDSRTGELASRFDKKNTPTMGGLLIFASVFVSALLWAEPNVWVVTALFVYMSLTGVGFRDDYLKALRKNKDGISSREKMFWQTLVTVATLVILVFHPTSSDKIRELWVPFLKEPVFIFAGSLGLIALFVMMFFWIVGFSNAINLTDGLDGLAIGCTITVALVYGIMAYAAGNSKIAAYLLISFVPGTGELAVVCAALVGAGMAFLWYNSHPAEVFMGDTGSLALGGLIGVIAFMVQQPLTLAIVGGVFVVEALSVIIQVSYFKYTKRRSPTGEGIRFFKMAPIHHHFQKLGWPETKVVLRFWVISLMCSLAGLATLKIR